MTFSENARKSRESKGKSKVYEDKRKDWRKRAWTCVVYPDSAPEEWKEILHKHGIAYDISPLHDKDLNSEGEKKKPHYHVILDFGAGKVVSGDTAIEIFDSIGGVYPDPKKSREEFLKACKVKKVESAWRYLCHLDEHDPSKHHYRVDDVVSGHHELPYSRRCMRADEVDDVILEMCDFVDKEDIYDFATFVRKARVAHPEWMHDVIHDHAGTFVNRFINGKLSKNREMREYKKYIMNKWRYEKEMGIPVPDEALERMAEGYLPSAFRKQA